MFRQLAGVVLHGFHVKKEAESTAHQIYREKSVNTEEKIPGFVDIQKTGVIYVTSRAGEFGFSYENKEWANLGQGAPETSTLEGQPPREFTAEFNAFNNEYSPVAGEIALRKKVHFSSILNNNPILMILSSPTRLLTCIMKDIEKEKPVNTLTKMYVFVLEEGLPLPD